MVNDSGRGSWGAMFAMFGIGIPLLSSSHIPTFERCRNRFGVVGNGVGDD